MKKSKVLSFKYFLYDLVRITAAIPGLIWFRPKKIFESKEAKKIARGGALLMANHVSVFDPMYLLFGYWRRRQRIVAMAELYSTKFNRWLFKNVFLTIKIDRQNFSMSSLKEITDNLKVGNVVTIFPEGRVNAKEEGMQDFKGGIVMMALRGKAPIIPIYIKRRKHFYNRLVFVMGNPIDLNSLKPEGIRTKADIEFVSDYLKKKEEELEALCLKK